MTPERAQFETPTESSKPGRGAGKSGAGIPRILIVQTGSANVLIEKHGDYPDWFRRSLNAGQEREIEMPILRAHQHQRLSPESIDAHRADAIIVTGSPLSVISKEQWMVDLAGELHRAGERGTPVLGVCFGHQLLAQGAGVEVIKNPRGREIGTVEVQLTEEGARDPLFAWAKEELKDGRIPVQATHSDAVYPLPPGATLLASNENTPIQAVRYSETVASVQFHPELSTEALRDLIASREALLENEGLSAAKISAAVRETRSGEILRAFAHQVRHG